MGKIIQEAYKELSGAVEESGWDEGHYSVGGRPISKVLAEMQRDCFRWIVETERPCTVTFSVLVNPDQYADTEGGHPFVAVPSASSSSVERSRHSIESVAHSGRVDEYEAGGYFLVDPWDGEHDLTTSFDDVVMRALDALAGDRAAASVALTLRVLEFSQVIGA